jgi:hypothetical protein
MKRFDKLAMELKAELAEVANEFHAKSALIHRLADEEDGGAALHQQIYEAQITLDRANSKFLTLRIGLHDSYSEMDLEAAISSLRDFKACLQQLNNSLKIRDLAKDAISAIGLILARYVIIPFGNGDVKVPKSFGQYRSALQKTLDTCAVRNKELAALAMAKGGKEAVSKFQKEKLTLERTLSKGGRPDDTDRNYMPLLSAIINETKKLNVALIASKDFDAVMHLFASTNKLLGRFLIEAMVLQQ